MKRKLQTTKKRVSKQKPRKNTPFKIEPAKVKSAPAVQMLGKIMKAEFGTNTPEGENTGLGLVLGSTKGNGWEVAEFRPAADVAGILKQAHCKAVSGLIGLPVVVTIENDSMKSWRVLDEVL